MSRLRRRAALMADAGALRELLEKMSHDDVYLLDRLGVEDRIEQVDHELTALNESPRRTAEAILYFYGEPVVESDGIDARFSADVLGSYQDLVSKALAAGSGPVGKGGPVRNEKDTRLHVTNVVHGSFGFELEELADCGPLVGPSVLATAVDAASKLISAAGDDDDFAALAPNTDARVYAALRDFFGVVMKANAQFRLVSDNVDVSFDKVGVEAAAERTAAERTEQGEHVVPGLFIGVMFDSRRFEHRDDATGVVIKGRFAEAVDPRSFVQWLDKKCVAHFQVVTLTRPTGVQTRYVLNGVTPLETKSGA